MIASTNQDKPRTFLSIVTSSFFEKLSRGGGGAVIPSAWSALHRSCFFSVDYPVMPFSLHSFLRVATVCC